MASLVSTAERMQLACRLTRHFGSDREAAHAPALAVIVVHRIVLCAAVVPDGECARRPAHAAGKFRPRLVLLQEIDERPALGLAHVAEADGMAAAHVQRLAPGLGMRAHDGVLGLVLLGALGVMHFHATDAAVHFAASAAV